MSEVQVEKIKFGGLFGYRWSRNDRLLILGINEDTGEQFTFIGQQFRVLLDEVRVPLRNSSDPVVRTKAFYDHLERQWSSTSAFAYLGSTPATSRHRRHCVLVQSWHIPSSLKDTKRTGYQSLESGLNGHVLGRTSQHLIEYMRFAYQQNVRSEVA